MEIVPDLLHDNRKINYFEINFFFLRPFIVDRQTFNFVYKHMFGQKLKIRGVYLVRTMKVFSLSVTE